MRTRIIPIIGTAFTDTTDDLIDCVDDTYHVAVPPTDRLDLQRRIAKAVYTLPRPISETMFWGAAVMREDAHWGIGQPWPTAHVEIFCAVTRRMWGVVSHTQLVLSQ